MRTSLKAFIMRVLPWIVTVGALYFAFKGVNFSDLLEHVRSANPFWIIASISLTSVSYFLRAARWQKLFPSHALHFGDSLRVLILGFFMNNVLPARAGEFIRAHLGARVSHQKRTLVLATIASERLVDGLTISGMFAAFALGLGDQAISHHLLIVAYLFLAVGIAVLLVIVFREQLFRVLEILSARLNHKAAHFASEKLQVFVHGLTPLSSRHLAPQIALWSAIIWTVELLVYFSISRAFSAHLSWPLCVLFLVAVNFSSLIPSAPGAIGVIEAVAKAVLVSVGVNGDLALTMALTQHCIQYLVIGIPGAYIMLTWKGVIAQVRHDAETGVGEYVGQATKP